MSTGIDTFLAIASGPLKLRSDLLLRTRPIIALFKALEPIRAVRTEVPTSVLGGDFLAVMSRRLREILEYSGQPERTIKVARANKSRFASDPVFVGVSEKEGFSRNPVFVKESPTRFAPWGKSAFQKPDEGSPFPASSKQATETDPFVLIPVPNVTQSARESAMVVSSSHRPSLQGKAYGNPKRTRNRQAAASILVEKLREYWRLSQQEQASGRDSYRFADAEKEEGGNTASLPASPLSALAQRSWPEMMGHQVARKIRSLASGQGASNSLKPAQQTIHSDLPEKVEIQNVFNLEVKTEGGGGTGSTEDLSERIADILRDQALHHGIDIT